MRVTDRGGGAALQRSVTRARARGGKLRHTAAASCSALTHSCTFSADGARSQ
jgi:hypothetical protein